MSITSTTNPQTTSTIQEFLSFKNSDEISYDSLSFKDKYDNIIYPIKNIIDDYYDELMELAVDVTMNSTEYLMYKYRPRILAGDIYNNPELDFLIMRMNGICNVKEFDMKTIKLLKMDDLTDFITSIYNANKNDIDVYNSTSGSL